MNLNEFDEWMRKLGWKKTLILAGFNGLFVGALVFLFNLNYQFLNGVLSFILGTIISVNYFKLKWDIPRQNA